jgi:protein-L-isoaspartate(D-aspartate) O-methyltransferase
LIKAFKEIPREKFVLKEYKEDAYKDIALPILMGQTISQPTTIMVMLHSLEIERGQNILEVGTGSGYTASLMSRLVGDKGKIISLEIVPELADFAKKNLRKLKVKNVKVVLSDGSVGYSKYAPYNRILVNAACPNINKTFLGQLKRHGIVILPVGGIYGQKLIKITKNHEIHIETLGDFLFVPIRGRYGY